MHYKEILPVSRQDAEAAFATENPDMICDALVRITYHDPDWRWVQEHCLAFTRHLHADIRGLAVTCLGHLARLHGILDTPRVLPVLESLRRDLDVAGRVEDALDDIHLFLRRVVEDDRRYKHNLPEFSDCDRHNAASHLRSLLFSNNVMLPVHSGKVILGRFQSVIFAELDGPRERNVKAQLMGE